MDDTMIVYMIWCESTEMLYVGQSARSLAERMKQHRRDAKRNGGRLYAEVRLLGWDAFEVFVLERCSSIAELNEREAWWIEHTSADDTAIGYNSKPGGGRRPITDEQRERYRIAAIKRGRRKHTEETKQACREAYQLHVAPPTPEQLARSKRRRLWHTADPAGRKKLASEWGQRGAASGGKASRLTLPRTPEQAARLERKRLWAQADADGRRELLRSWGRKGAEASRIA
jgi:hypothetical protein